MVPCGGIATGSENSFSTNKFIHNFVEEKKR